MWNRGCEKVYKVVIVDDEYVVREWMSKSIPWKKWNCEVVATAHDGKEGLQIIERHVPDIVFSEITMPRVNGLQMIEELKSEFENMEISILTEDQDFRSAQQAVNLGVRRFLLKPFRTEEIGEAVEAMVANVKKKEIVHCLEGNHSKERSFIVDDAIRYIEEHYEERLTLAEVAEHTYVSQWHLSKLLNRDIRRSFSDILNTTRIGHAKDLLDDRTLRISDIAGMVGFLDIAHFSRVFKKYEGISANEYRKRLHRMNFD